jgi:NADH:ubiquinone oxidoreductase subunit 4 (subunit M)
MMEMLGLLLAAIFLPLFPLGMVFNLVFQRTRNVWLRSVLLVTWPFSGLYILEATAVQVPVGFAFWALISAVLYGFRALVIREVGVWTGFLATSAWALVWVSLSVGLDPGEPVFHVLAFSLPLVLLALMTAEVESRYESAYAGIVSGIAEAQPRLAGVLVIIMLAVIGSPLFPAFFALLDILMHAVQVLPVAALGVVVVWMLWSWSGIQLLQKLLVGPAMAVHGPDMSRIMTVGYGLTLSAMLVAGIYLSGMML